ncbi:HIT family protein [uncultured Parasutterella sp.]|uniref:HIT family protein n=1 Tax=uncultured Parasutterella sp. TaxID=1263098 RepID=UPI0034A4595D
MTQQCLFCHLPDQLKVQAENALAFAIFDGFPVNPGHTLIIPKRHVASYFDLTEDEVQAMHELLRQMKVRIENEFHPDGFNIGVNVGEAAGQSVFHVHMHLIPRFKGDIENPRGGVRGVIPAKRSY